MKTIRDPKVIDFIKNKNKEENSWAYSDDGETSMVPYISGYLSLFTCLTATNYMAINIISLFALIVLNLFWAMKLFNDIRMNFIYEIGYKKLINCMYLYTHIITPLFFIAFDFSGLFLIKLSVLFVFGSNLFSFLFLFFFMRVKWIEHRYDEFKFEPDPNYISWEAMVQRYFDKR